MWVICSNNTANTIPHIPIARCVCALDEDEPCAGRESAADRLAAAVAGVAADFADALQGCEKVGYSGNTSS